MKSTYKSKDDLSGMKVRGRYPQTVDAQFDENSLWIPVERISILGRYVKSSCILYNIFGFACCLFCIYGRMLDFLSTK